MASQDVALSNWQYTINGGNWQQGSGHDVSVGIDGGGNIYRGYIAFSLANFSASYLIQDSSLFFRRSDNYGNTAYWAIGLRSSLPPKNFTTADFEKTVTAELSVASPSDKTVTITAANLSPYVGKTVYVCFVNSRAGNTYGEIETDAGTPDKRPKLTVNYNYAKSTITASNGTIGSQQTITVTRQDAAYTHTLTATCAGRTETIATKSSNLSLTWTPSVANFAPLITNAMSASCTYTLTTYYGNTSVGTDSKTVTLSLPSASVAPTLSLSVVDNAGYASHFNNKYIVGKSVFKVTATPSLKYSATQSSLTITANGSTYYSSPATTGTVKSGQTSISAKVTDSRSQSATASTTVTLLSYANPNLTVTVQRCTSGGTADSSGAYCKVTSTYSISALDNINTRSLTVKYKKASAGSYTSVARTISAYTGTDTYIFAADTDSSYNVQVVLSDYFSSSTVNKVLPTISVVFDLHSSGTGMAFGKVAETANLLESAWPLRLRDKSFDIYDGSGVRRIYMDSNQFNTYDNTGTMLSQIRIDGGASSAPLPVSQGGTGVNFSTKGISSAPTESGAQCWDFVITADFTINGVVFPNYAKGRFICSGSDAIIFAVGFDGQIRAAFRNGNTWANAYTSANQMIARSFSTTYSDLPPNGTKFYDESFITVPTGYAKVGVIGISTNASGVYPRSFILRGNVYSFEIQNQTTSNASGTLTVSILFARTGTVGS